MKFLDRLRRRLLDRVGHGHDPHQCPVNGDEHRRLAFCAQGIGFCFGFLRIEPHLLHHRRIAEGHYTSAHLAAHTFAGERLEI